MFVPLPFTPGLEAAGVVVEAGDASRFAVGDRVIAYCASGAFAAKLAAPGASLFPCPATMSDAKAAGLMITGLLVGVDRFNRVIPVFAVTRGAGFTEWCGIDVGVGRCVNRTVARQTRGRGRLRWRVVTALGNNCL